ncbi:MFS transporter [Kibdelosporangium aridum]|uniref:Predicted arabinose efflux permease, MFS family n=1 Tax=Kibdelosporangium aridum TaxID=2030 RepID=A0A1W2FQ67_KIBAR|nr:MFS transporter [Kibdelosporangium aridum]SMD24075.1 Predicted arabinose efflux permease, MFS family [Kibdelosporangium aridum]
MIGRGVVLLLALTCGVAVGNLYFPQAISPLVASGLGIPVDSAVLVVTAAQIGYAVGIFLLVPLGDRIPLRPLVVTLLGLTGLSLAVASSADSLPPLFGASVLIGITTVVAPAVAPIAAGLVAQERQGAVTGTLLSGSLGGMLLSRAFGGVLGEWLTWRAPYLVAAALALILALVLAFALPKTTPPTRQRYPALVAASVRLVLAEPEIRRSCFYQMMIFGAFQAVWTGVALLLTGPVYGLGAHAVGVLAFVNAATMIATPLAGRQVDRRGPDPVNLVCMIAVLISAAVMLGGVLGGVVGLAALAVGTLVLDVAMQSGMIANMVRNFAQRPDARSRVNTAYMTCAFLGGGLGSWLGSRAYVLLGWSGVCALVAVMASAALIRHLQVSRTGSSSVPC